MGSGLDLDTDAWLREHERAVEMAQEIAASLQVLFLRRCVRVIE